jgi:hypothetical protein
MIYILLFFLLWPAIGVPLSILGCIADGEEDYTVGWLFIGMMGGPILIGSLLQSYYKKINFEKILFKLKRKHD